MADTSSIPLNNGGYNRKFPRKSLWFGDTLYQSKTEWRLAILLHLLGLEFKYLPDGLFGGYDFELELKL